MEGKYIWLTKMSSKGQIVIPKEARNIFDINDGDKIVLFGDKQKGIAMVKFDECADIVNSIFNKGDSDVRN